LSGRILPYGEGKINPKPDHRISISESLT